MMHRQRTQAIIGKTISGVIARPGSDGREVVLLQFDDGTCFELLSEGARRELRRHARRRQRDAAAQLSIFPASGELQAA